MGPSDASSSSRLPVRLYSWLARPNFGDALSEAVVAWLLGEGVRIVGSSAARKLLAVGSILQSARAGDVVWGAGVHPKGFDRFWLAPDQLRDIAVLAVRGPITRDSLLARGIECPEIYGDPGILLPILHRPSARRVPGRRGLVAHFSDAAQVRSNPPDGLEVIDVADPWPEVVARICTCESLVSSSLHGVIVAEAYGIPATWWRPSFGEGVVKFQDYYLSTGRIGHPVYSLADAIAATGEQLPDFEPMRNALLAAFDADLVRARCAVDLPDEDAAHLQSENERPPGADVVSLRADLGMLRIQMARLLWRQFSFFDEEGRPARLVCTRGHEGAELFDGEDWGDVTDWGAFSSGARAAVTLPARTHWHRAATLKLEVIVNLRRSFAETLPLVVSLAGQDPLRLLIARTRDDDEYYTYFLLPLSDAMRRNAGPLRIAFEMPEDIADPNKGAAQIRILAIEASAGRADRALDPSG